MSAVEDSAVNAVDDVTCTAPPYGALFIKTVTRVAPGLSEPAIITRISLAFPVLLTVAFPDVALRSRFESLMLH
eukprot:1614559-Prymnesium_polylepis.1